MTVNDHLERFHGLPVFDFVEAFEAAEEEGGSDAPRLPEADAVAWRLRLEYESEATFVECWEQF
ncbi:hypothetical protein ACFRMQ_39005, partial [Kitasatospora sp. NPDC056783]